MPTSLKRLPGTTVSDALYEAVRAYAYQNNISKSEAVRQLLESSPMLSIDTNERVGTWGGKRDKPVQEPSYVPVDD